MRATGLAAVSVAVGISLAACSGDDSGSVEEFCSTVRADTTVGSVFADGFDPTHRTRALEQLGDARITLGELRDTAPDEVRDDLVVELDYVDALIEVLEGTEGEEPEAIVARVQRVTDEHSDVGQAAAALAAFAQEECGF